MLKEEGIMRRQFIISLGCAILILSCSHLTIAEETSQAVEFKDQAPVAEAQAWLAMVDKKQYEQSWEIASAYFKSMITSEQWVSQVAAVRDPLGDHISRDLKTNLYQKTMPGAPDGEYYVLTFNTVFKNKASAVETVTMMKDRDGQWRLAGYFIR
jgi:hypothetical protein